VIIVGLTGGIASGKTTITSYIKKKRIPIHDSDAVVRGLYKKPTKQFLKYLKKIKLDNSLDGKKINKTIIQDNIFNNLKKKKLLEKYIHHAVGLSRDIFLEKQKKLKARIVFLDIPLLFEKKIDRICDYVILVYAPLYLRKKRALKRKGMKKSTLNRIIKSQLGDNIKKNKSDFIINTSTTRSKSNEQILKVIKIITSLDEHERNSN